MDIIYLETVDSTNSEINRILRTRQLPEGTAVFAKEQISGRGQRGNSWKSALGENITLSFVFYPTFLNLNFHFCLSQAVALGVLDFFNSLIPDEKSFSLKWPNDIYFKEKKIGGILIENTLQGDIIKESIVGVGLNINQEVFDTCIPNPISLRLITQKYYKLNDLIFKLSEKINSRYDILRANNLRAIINDYNLNLFRRNVFSKFREEGQVFDAKILNVEPDGKLNLLTTGNKLLGFYFKEIEFVL